MGQLFLIMSLIVSDVDYQEPVLNMALWLTFLTGVSPMAHPGTWHPVKRYVLPINMNLLKTPWPLLASWQNWRRIPAHEMQRIGGQTAHAEWLDVLLWFQLPLSCQSRVTIDTVSYSHMPSDTVCYLCIKKIKPLRAERSGMLQQLTSKWTHSYVQYIQWYLYVYSHDFRGTFWYKSSSSSDPMLA